MAPQTATADWEGDEAGLLFPGNPVPRPPPRRRALWDTAPFVLGCEFCERLCYYGLATNLVTYLGTVMRMSSASSAQAVNSWSGGCYMTPLLGAYLADSGWGRYRTIVVFSVLYAAGVTLLAVSAGVPEMHPAAGATSATAAQMAVLYLALWIVAVGTGGIKANVGAFGADQFDEHDPRDTADKKSFFNYFYVSINVGSLLASVVIVPVQLEFSWSLGFAIPAACMIAATATLLAGRRRYRHEVPSPGPLGRLAGVVCNAIANRGTPLPRDQPSTPHLWLSRAEHGRGGNYSALDVSDARSIMRLLPMLLCGVMYWVTYSQMGTLFVLQGNQMNTKVGSVTVPAASLCAVDTIVIVLVVPLFDSRLYPWLERRGWLTLTRKVGWGNVVAALAMLCAGAVEHARLRAAATRPLQPGVDAGHPAADLSVLWQAPQYALVGISEIFTSIGQLELCYAAAPQRLRSSCMALQLVSTALGSYAAAWAISVVQAASGGTWIADELNRGRLDLYFFTLAAAMVAFHFLYLRVAATFDASSVRPPRECPTADEVEMCPTERV